MDSVDSIDSIDSTVALEAPAECVSKAGAGSVEPQAALPLDIDQCIAEMGVGWFSWLVLFV